MPILAAEEQYSVKIPMANDSVVIAAIMFHNSLLQLLMALTTVTMLVSPITTTLDIKLLSSSSLCT